MKADRNMSSIWKEVDNQIFGTVAVFKGCNVSHHFAAKHTNLASKQ